MRGCSRAQSDRSKCELVFKVQHVWLPDPVAGENSRRTHVPFVQVDEGGLARRHRAVEVVDLIFLALGAGLPHGMHICTM